MKNTFVLPPRAPYGFALCPLRITFGFRPFGGENGIAAAEGAKSIVPAFISRTPAGALPSRYSSAPSWWRVAVVSPAQAMWCTLHNAATPYRGYIVP